MLLINEMAVLDRLDEVWTAYLKLPQQVADGGHPEDVDDFRYHFHRLQDLVVARSGYRELRKGKLHERRTTAHRA